MEVVSEHEHMHDVQPDSRGSGGQDFRNIHNAGYSRSHFGNVINNNYQSANRLGLDEKLAEMSDAEKAKLARAAEKEEKEKGLMAALEFDGMENRLMSISPACANTCTWFLHTPEYTRWGDLVHRRLHNGVLWIKGKAGTGKSTLMRYIHDNAQRRLHDHITLAFFFNNRSPNPLSKSTEGMYRSLLCQLYRHIPRLKVAAALKFSVTRQHIWSIEILEDLLRGAVLGLSSDEKVTCYIDALDECEDNQVRSAIKCFESISQSATLEGARFLLCFSSRHYPHITMRPHEEVKLDVQSAHLQDIRTYLDDKFTIDAPCRPELQLDIERRCSGIFLWVVLVVEMLKNEFDQGATRSQLRKILTQVPDQLDALFAKICESATDAFRVAIRWVLFAEQSLQPAELYFAIMTGTGKLTSAYWDWEEVSSNTINRAILHISRGLIECRVQGQTQVQFIHESVRQHLLAGGLGNTDCTLQPNPRAVSQMRMAEDCMRYLRLGLLGQTQSTYSAENTLMLGRGTSLEWFNYPLLEYALGCVFKHCEHAHIGAQFDFDFVEKFPTQEFTELYNEVCCFDQQRLIPHHPATLLMLLLQMQCSLIATSVLERHLTAPGANANKQSKDTEMRTTLGSFAKADLGTFCGGKLGSPLHHAARDGHTTVATWLLDHGADVNLSGKVQIEGFWRVFDSPLKLAVAWKLVGTVRLLLDRGADVDSLDVESRHQFDKLMMQPLAQSAI